MSILRLVLYGIVFHVAIGGTHHLASGDDLRDTLREVRVRQNLEMPDSSVLQDRKWSSQNAQDSLEDYILARQALRKGRPVEAAAMLRSAIRRDPTNAAAWAELAELRSRDNQFSKAIQAWAQVLAINPQDTNALLALGMQASLEGRIDEAARQLVAWRLLDGHDNFDRAKPFQTILAQGALAEALELLGETEAAEEARNEARAAIMELASGRYGFDPDLPQWLTFVTRLYQHRAFESGFDAVSVALKSPWMPDRYQPDVIIVAVGLAVLFDDGQAVSRMYRELDAAGDLDLSATIAGTTALDEALFETGNIFTQLGNDTGAAWLYEDVVELNPRHVMARNNLGYYLLEQNRLDPAVQRMIISAWEAAPDDSAVLDSYGWMQYLLGRFQDGEDGPGAVNLLQQAHDQSGDYPSAEVLDHLGDALFRIGDRQGARQSWSAALEMLTQPEVREAMINQLDQRQERLWGWWIGRIRNSRAVYDSKIQLLQRRLTDKLSALDSEQPPPVRLTEAERRMQQK